MAKRFPRIGELRQRAVIKNRADEEVGQWSCDSERSTTQTVWCKIVNVSGTTQVDSRNAGSGTTHQVTMRYRVDISAQDEIYYRDGRGETYRYQVQTIQNAGDERNRFLICDCLQLEVDGEYLNGTAAGELISNALFISENTEYLELNADGDVLLYA